MELDKILEFAKYHGFSFTRWDLEEMEERGEITFRNDGVDVTRINLRYWDRSCHYDEFHVRVNITKA